VGPAPVTTQAFPNQYAQGFPSNNSVMLAYASKRNPDPFEAKCDMGMGELMFVRTNEPGLKTMPYPEYQFRNISRLNAHLQSPQCRKEYGREFTCAKLLRDWQLIGIQQRDPVDYGSLSSDPRSSKGSMLEQVSTMIPGMRARVWNFWTASGVAVRPGNRLWVIPTRRKFVSQVAEALNTEEEEYYWRFEPFVTTSSAPPPMCMYSTAWFHSIPLLVGSVVEMYGNLSDQIELYFGNAHKAIFPDKPDARYREHLYKCNEVVIFIGVK
jgi:hypothetical protein